MSAKQNRKIRSIDRKPSKRNKIMKMRKAKMMQSFSMRTALTIITVSLMYTCWMFNVRCVATMMISIHTYKLVARARMRTHAFNHHCGIDGSVCIAFKMLLLKIGCHHGRCLSFFMLAKRMKWHTIATVVCTVHICMLYRYRYVWCLRWQKKKIGKEKHNLQAPTFRAHTKKNTYNDRRP